MKKILMLLVAGTLASGVAAYYASAQMVKTERLLEKDGR